MLKVMAFCHLRENLVINMVKKLIYAATKTGMDVAKSASKPVVQKTAEATADLIGNKIAVKITSLGKTKSKKKEEERQEIYIPPEKRQQVIGDMSLDCFKHHIKMEYQKIANLLGTTPNEWPRFITKKQVEVHDQSGDANDRYKPNKPIRFKTSMLRSDLCDFSDVYIVVKGEITVTGANNISKKNRHLAFKNNARFIGSISKINNKLIDNAEELDVAIPMYNCLNIAKIIQKLTKNLLNSKQVLQRVLTMLMKELPIMQVIKSIIPLMM